MDMALTRYKHRGCSVDVIINKIKLLLTISYISTLPKRRTDVESVIDYFEKQSFMLRFGIFAYNLSRIVMKR